MGTRLRPKTERAEGHGFIASYPGTLAVGFGSTPALAEADYFSKALDRLKKIRKGVIAHPYDNEEFILAVTLDEDISLEE